jgi:hypothetical protein
LRRLGPVAAGVLLAVAGLIALALAFDACDDPALVTEAWLGRGLG